MIALWFLGWYVVGVILAWRLLIRIDPVFTTGDIGPTLFAGLFGPLMLIFYPFYWFNTYRSPPPRKIEWLSGNE